MKRNKQQQQRIPSNRWVFSKSHCEIWAKALAMGSELKSEAQHLPRHPARPEGSRFVAPFCFFAISFLFRFLFFLVGCESNVNREYISFSCRLTHPHNQTLHATPSLLWKKYHSTHTQLWPLPYTHLPRPLPPTGPMACHAPHCCCHSVCLRIWRFFPALPTHFFHFLFFAGYAAFVRLYVTAWAGIFTDSVLDEHVNVWFLLRVELKQWAGWVFRLWLDIRQFERSSNRR